MLDRQANRFARVAAAMMISLSSYWMADLAADVLNA